MKANIKKKSILACSAAFLACIGGYFTISNISANAEAADYSFYLNGASIKKISDEYIQEGQDAGAIRFQLVMSEDFFAYNEETSEYSLVEEYQDFGVLMVPANMSTGEIVYGAQSVSAFSFADKIDATIKDVKGRDEVAFYACVYNIPDNYYRTGFKAVGYVFDGEEYMYTDVMERSIAQVAFLADDAGEEGVTSYFDAQKTGWVTTILENDERAYVAYQDYGTETYGADYTYTINGEETIKDVGLNGKTLAYTQSVAGGKTMVTIDSEDMAAADIREDNKFIFFTENGACVYNASNLVTAELSDKEDVVALLANMKAITEGPAAAGYVVDAFVGHYKLTANVDFEGENINPTSATCQTMVSYSNPFNDEWYEKDGFQAVFNGNGYAIENVNLSWRTYNGFFGEIGKNGVVKNLSLLNFTMEGNNGMLACQNYGKVTDCFVSGYFSGKNTSTVDVSAFLVGINHGEISNCLVLDNNEDMKLQSAAFVSQNYGTISDCYIVTKQNVKTYGFSHQYALEDGQWVDLGLFNINDLENEAQTFNTPAIGGLPFAFYNRVYKQNGNYQVPDESVFTNCGKFGSIADITNEFANSNMYKRVGGSFYWGNVRLLTVQQALEQENVGDIIIGETSTITVDELASDVISSVKVDDVEVFVSQSGSVITLDGTKLSESSKLSSVIIETNMGAYGGNIVIVEEISSESEFIAMLQDAKAKMNNTGGFTGYYRLTANLDFTSVTATNWNSYTMYTHVLGGAKGWQAVFDGNGYSLSNIALGSATGKGLFGTIGSDGVVRNLSIFNITFGSQAGGLCYFNYGTVENVYMEYGYKYDGPSNTGLGALAMAAEGGSKFINCVTVDKSTATYTGAGLLLGWARNNNKEGDITFENCYAVTSTYSKAYNPIYQNTVNADVSDVKVCASMEEFISSAEDLDLLDTTTNVKKWGNVTIYTEEIVQEAVKLTSKVDMLSTGETVTVAGLLGGEVLTGATIGGVDVTVSNSGTSVTFGAFATVGEQELVLTGQKAQYIGTVRVVTSYISSADDFNTMLANKIKASTSTGFTGYYLLTTSITSGIENTNMLGGNEYARFEGTFDGNGYSIGGITVGGTAGSAIFGTLGTNGVIKNLAVIGVKISANTTGTLTYNCYGTIENVYVKVDLNLKQSAPFAYFAQKDCTIKNCVANVYNPGNSGSALLAHDYNANFTVENCVILTSSDSAGAKIVVNASTFSCDTTQIQVSYSVADYNVSTLYSDTSLTLVAKLPMLTKDDSNGIYWGKTKLN